MQDGRNRLIKARFESERAPRYCQNGTRTFKQHALDLTETDLTAELQVLTLRSAPMDFSKATRRCQHQPMWKALPWSTALAGRCRSQNAPADLRLQACKTKTTLALEIPARAQNECIIIVSVNEVRPREHYLMKPRRREDVYLPDDIGAKLRI